MERKLLGAPASVVVDFRREDIAFFVDSEIMQNVKLPRCLPSRSERTERRERFPVVDHHLLFGPVDHIQITLLGVRRERQGLPMKKGRCGSMPHNYKRNGTTTLFAALDLLQGKVIGDFHQRGLKRLADPGVPDR